MIKKIALSGLLLSLLSFPLLAQQTAAPDAPTQTNTRMGRNRAVPHQMGDPAVRAKKMTDRMMQHLGLDQTTAQKVYDVTLSRAQKVNDIQASTNDNRAKQQALKANADEYKANLKRILTPDQFAKLDAMKGHMRNGRRGSDGGSDSKEQK